MTSSDAESAFPEFPEGLVKPQKNSVVAFMDEPDQVEAAMEGLVAHGFDREQIYVLCGTEGAQRLDVSGRHHGLMSDEKGILFRARDHLATGGLVVSVPADEDQKAPAARILGGHGGHGMAHFGPDHWEPLGS